jgi:DNA-binding MarR family transcriptional regulator
MRDRLTTVLFRIELPSISKRFSPELGSHAMPASVALPSAEAACLQLLRTGIGRPTTIALRCSHGVERIGRALATLSDLRLTEKGKDGVWGLTARGRTMSFSVLAEGKTRGRKPSRTAVPGSTVARLLALLETPRHRADLPALLGVTRERVRQLVVSQSAAGRIRGAGSKDPIFALALTGDPVVLLTYAQERVLSAFAEETPTTLSRLARVAHRPPTVMAQIADFLRDVGFIEEAGRAAHGVLWRLTPAGRSHWQRSPDVAEAEEPPLMFRSGRIANVLAYLAEQGKARTVDVARALDIPPQSMNALMQYLKRRGIVRVRSDAFRSPYVLTDEGRELLAAMTRRSDAA